MAAGVFMAFVGPFGSGGLSLAARLAYWLTTVLAGTGIGLIANAGVSAFVDPLGRRPLLMALLTAAVMTPPGVLVVYAITRLAFPPPFSLGGLGDFVAPVFVLSAAISAINSLANRTPRHTGAAAPDSAPPRFLQRLPARLKGAEIHAVQAEDHYLRLHTSKGSDLILLRLSDAIVELEGLEGAQTHRSWWVARAAVTGAVRGDGRATLQLPGGVEAPVSRRFARALRAEGWF